MFIEKLGFFVNERNKTKTSKIVDRSKNYKKLRFSMLPKKLNHQFDVQLFVLVLVEKMDFPRIYAKPRGSNLNNGEVQRLLRYQEGQVEKMSSSKSI